VDRSVYLAMHAMERSHWWFVARREILLRVTGHFLRPGARLLDVGCGTGFFLEAARERFDAWGVDMSPLAVSMCHERGLTQVAEGSAYDLTGVAGPFDGACFFDVIEHLDDDLGALRTAHAALADDGLVFVTVPAFQFLWSRHDEIHHHRRRYDRARLGRVLREAGFDPVHLTYFNFALFPAAALARLVGRLVGRSASTDLATPAAPLNVPMRRVFEAEKHWLVGRGRARRFPFGLSLLAVARKRPAA
jgi:SAM-dependent methyltransferase